MLAFQAGEELVPECFVHTQFLPTLADDTPAVLIPGGAYLARAAQESATARGKVTLVR